ncbi:hypothetical protein GGS20DRAFT_41895 [Poronia punctata]|nr:hypothetical protein GGS20DRAFT_41895 [Poronia punctata]
MNTTRPCFNFRSGRCRFGARCRFSHDLTISTTNHRPNAGPGSRPQRQESSGGGSASASGRNRIQEWKQLLHQGRYSPTRSMADRFFELAVMLVGGEAGECQETVKLLSEEDGLNYVRSLVDKRLVSAATDGERLDVWAKQLQPLLAIITHEHVVDSAVLEHHVATIYNFLQGVGSRRMKGMFDFAVKLADSAPVTVSGDTASSAVCKLVIVETCLAVLSKMVECNTNNIVDDKFKDVTQRLTSILEGLEATEETSESSNDYFMAQSQKWLRWINVRLGVGDELPSARSLATQRIGSRAEFALPKTLPGTLSASGRRHDNDHASIADIRILPTHGEITSTRGEYLPSNDPSSFHLPGIRGRLDREFRLLREDTVGQLRDAVRGILEIFQAQGQGQQRGHSDRQNLFTHTYQDVDLVGVSFESRRGLELSVGFRQPRKLNGQQRREWWTQSKRLQPGALVCIVDAEGSVLFCAVADSTVIGSGQEKKDLGGDEVKKDKLSLAGNDEFAYVKLNLAQFKDRNNLHQTMRWYRPIGPTYQRCLVEFPGVLLAAFQHTLEALQQMSKAPAMPFIDLIAPTTPSEGIVHVPPPIYASRAGFEFDLACLLTDKTIPLAFTPHKHLDPKTLAGNSTLDETQAVALLDCLSRSLALVQGPPGTGKSYTGEKIIKVLLANKERGKIGPILCVCYTNHALDQLLEHLIDDGVDQIVRIGSRSKSERLEKVNLRAIAQNADRTRHEKSSLYKATQALREQEGILSESLGELSFCLGRTALQDYLKENHPAAHRSLFRDLVDEEGFQEVRRGKPGRLLEEWLNGGDITEPFAAPVREVDQLVKETLWNLTRGERGKLYNYWLGEIRDPIIRTITWDHEEYVESKSARDRVHQEVDLRCLSAANVIGVTTTGLARNLDLLRRLKSKVLLFEEAGEVLEAHNITALLPSVEHCILIGDHLQLRPQIQNYDLSSVNPRGAEHSLDVSLFERLVRPLRDGSQQIPFSTLDTQRRMHPSISELIRQTLYPSLSDGGGVAEYPKVKGLKRRLFWLHHEVPEDRAQKQDPTTTSHTNSFEVDMTVALVQHLVRQGSYRPDDIAVVTPYLGQLHRLRRQMQNLMQISVGDRDMAELSILDARAEEQGEELGQALDAPARTTLLKSVRLATVDNFQGEEAKVVVISLVRSNAEKRCGFLSTPNRINVLLSRAKHGMYIMGNCHTYENVPMWANVIRMLRDKENIGPVLALQCPRHPERSIEVSTPDHFSQFSPEGGCLLRCDQRLSCGHACPQICHAQVLHNAVKCLDPCPRPKSGCDHRCRLPCGDVCRPKCDETLEGLDLPLSCGHIMKSPECWQFQHPSSVVCKAPVSKTVPGCNHTVTVPCHEDVAGPEYVCTRPCGDPQGCGHSCRGQCHRCKDRVGSEVVRVHHVVCNQRCGRKYTACRHSCAKPCHGDEVCPPCAKPCDARCSHSKCSKQCYEPCVPCAEIDCSSRCAHQKCTMPCAAPCDWVPCSRRCESVLQCGHQCPSLCGEACPDAKYCQTCCSEEIKAADVDFIMGLQYHEVNLDEDPCIFPDCGHFITKSNMDGVMDLKAHYEMSTEADSCPIAVSSNSIPFSMDEVKACPSCRGSLRNISRYGRIVRRALLDEVTKKFIAWSHSEFLALAKQLVDVQISLASATTPKVQTPQTDPTPLKQRIQKQKSRIQQLQRICDWVGDSRYKAAMQLRAKISSFIAKVRDEEQPLRRVADHVRHAKSQRQTLAEPSPGAFTLDETDIQVKGSLQASALSLKCDIIIFSDFMSIRSPLIPSRPGISLNLEQHLNDCQTLIDKAAAAQYPREQAEGHIYFAQFCAFARSLSPDSETEAETLKFREDVKAQGQNHISSARDLLARYKSIAALKTEIEAAEKMLRDSVFYAEVSEAELRAVFKAMSREFLGTGHWYTCVNGHPFTIGECGMPMEQARCPECASPVGGRHHAPVEGVRHATEIERLALDMNRLDV